MRWNLRMKAAERGIWKSTEMRRRLADAGLEISAGKMSASMDRELQSASVSMTSTSSASCSTARPRNS